MKNVPIKFRGVDIETGEYVYGECYTLCVPFFHFVDELGEHHNVEVDSDSICQLVGYDAEGNEVYEGDKLKFCGNPESYRYVQAYDEARITAGLESSDLPLSEYKLTSEDEFYNWQYNIHTDDYE